MAIRKKQEPDEYQKALRKFHKKSNRHVVVFEADISEDENYLLTEKDMASILLSDQGLRKDVGDRRYIAVLNQCDDSTVRESAEQVREMLINSTGQNSETIEKIVFAKLQ